VLEVTEDLQLLDSNQVGKLIGRHPRHVMRMANAGELPSVRIGERGIRFRPADLARRIEAHRVS
jgi:Helix-turn-helix domain